VKNMYCYCGSTYPDDVYISVSMYILHLYISISAYPVDLHTHTQITFVQHLTELQQASMQSYLRRAISEQSDLLKSDLGSEILVSYNQPLFSEAGSKKLS
jgi:hypothetical protein